MSFGQISSHKGWWMAREIPQSNSKVKVPKKLSFRMGSSLPPLAAGLPAKPSASLSPKRKEGLWGKLRADNLPGHPIISTWKHLHEMLAGAYRFEAGPVAPSTRSSRKEHGQQNWHGLGMRVEGQRRTKRSGVRHGPQTTRGNRSGRSSEDEQCDRPRCNIRAEHSDRFSSRSTSVAREATSPASPDFRCSSNSKSRSQIPRASVSSRPVTSVAMAVPGKMRAWLYKDYGPKENLQLTEVDVEKPAANQVLVKVHAAALNPIDYKRREGYLKSFEVVSPPHVPGYDLAGVVVALGSSAGKFKIGDRVYGDVSEPALKPKKYGTLAQYCAVDEALLDVIPESLNFVEAASLPVAILTAYQTLEFAKLTEDKTVLILGGAGGVGSAAVQLAAHVFKAKVVATTASGAKVDFVKGLGANVVIDYRKESVFDLPTKYDVVFDTVKGGEGPKAVKEGGFAVTVAGPPEPPEVMFGVTSRGSDLKKLAPYFESGVLKPVIDSKSPYKFEDVVEAYAYLETGRALGKVVVAPIE